MNTQSLEKKVIVISGGTGYIGSCVAKVLAGEGASIAILYQTQPPEKVEVLMSSLSGAGHKAYICDLRSEDAVSAILVEIEKIQGNIYASIHTAGQKPLRKKILQTTYQEMIGQFESTAMTGFNFLSLCAKKMKEHGEGVIIGITTAGVVIPEASQALGAYTPAKYALQGVLTMLKQELLSHSVRVYSVAPGFMEGGMNSDIPKAFVEMIRQKSKGKKLTSAEEIAAIICNLCIGEQKEETKLTYVLAPEYE